MIAATGCTSSAGANNCVPVMIDEKYPIRGSSEGGFFSTYYGVAIIDEQAYMITQQEAFDNLKENETQRIAVGIASMSYYAYIYEVCEE